MENLNNTKFTLRIDSELIEKLKLLAQANKRSLNKEIEFALEIYANQFSVVDGKLIHESDIQQ